jgi:hypothetical protein
MAQLAAPVALVVAVQLCAVDPVPRVRTTGWLAMGVGDDEVPVVRTPERVTDVPSTVAVAPVYEVMESVGVTTKLAGPLVDNRLGSWVVSPPKVAESEYVPDGS